MDYYTEADIEDEIRKFKREGTLTIPLATLRKRGINPLELIEIKPIKKNGILSKHICLSCGKKFKSIKHYKKYCSNKCTRKNYYKKIHSDPILKSNKNKKIQIWFKKRKMEDTNFLIKTRLRDRLRDAIRFYNHTKKFRRSNEYINYEAVIKHLGPCPGDKRLYHIDHIKPLQAFDFSKDEEIKKAFAPENHQWLLARDNIIKGRRERNIYKQKIH